MTVERLEERSLLSIVAAYGFNEGSGSTVYDSSGNGNNGTISNASWSTAGKYGDCLSFNGSNALVTVNDASSLDLTNGLTLEAWVKPSAIPDNWIDVVYKGSGGNDNYYLESSSTRSSVPVGGALLTSGQRAEANGTSALKTGSWTYLAATYDGTTMRLYINARQVASTKLSGTITTGTGPLSFGGDSYWGQYFNGLIDEVRIYNNALTASQIKTDMITPIGNAAPTITSETPASSATNVNVSTAPTGTFNEAVQASTISFTLKNSSGTAVSGAVSYNPNTYVTTFTPSSALAYNMKYTATISGAVSTSGVAMTGPFTWSFTTDTAPPSVVSETPASGATGVAVTTAPTATFNKAVQSSTISFTLVNSSGTAVSGTVSYNSSTYVTTFTPSSALAYSTTYTATVSGAKDSAGDPMGSAFSWSFTTGSTPPPPTGLVAAYAFDEGSGSTVHDASGNGNNGTISGATWSTSGKYGDALSFNGTSAMVTVSSSTLLQLTTGMTLEAWVNPASVTSSWTDAIYKGQGGQTASSDNYYLEATSTNNMAPVGGGELGSGPSETDAVGTAGVAANTWTFLAVTYDGSTMRLYVNATQVASTSGSGNIETSTGQLSIGGDSIWGQYFQGLIDNVRIYNQALTQSQIQTDMSSPINTAPTITSETPASGATNVNLSTAPTGTFNESVQPSTISFTLKNSSGTAVSGAVTYNSTTYVTTFTPASALAYNTTYTATISGAVSTGGVAMTGPVTWSFTTDPAAPTVTTESPASGATGVAVSATPSATFNEAMQASSITFTLKNSSGTSVSGTVSYNSTTYTTTFTPSSALANSTTYTGSVNGNDSAGDPMGSPYSWSFTTAAAGAPVITSETPASGATDVAVSVAPTGTFNEAVKSTSISFTLKNSSGTSVSGTVSYNSTTYVTTFSPSSPLAFNTTYTATISGAVSTGGVPMGGPFSWSFTTDPAAPTVTSETPANGATDVLTSVAPTGTFNEAVQSSTISFTLTSSGGSVSGTVSYNSTTYVTTFTPSAALAYNTTYTATISGALDTAGDPMQGSVSWSFTTDPPPSGSVMVLQNYDGSTMPTNNSGDTYPSEYPGSGTGTATLDTTNAVEGNSVKVQVSSGGLQAQWNPYQADGTRVFASYYANNDSTGGLSLPSGWQYNTYDHMSFWVLRPTNATPLETNGSSNVEFGTYVKQIKNEDPHSDETGGDHYYSELNFPANGQWTQVIINMHPNHFRSEPGGEDPGFVPYPTATNGPNGGDDPPNTYNFFDTLTRFYFDETIKSYFTGTWLFDDFNFYQAPYAQDDAQISSLTATYNPSNNEVIVTWDRPTPDNSVIDNVRYSFSDIEQIGWNNATPAPGGSITPPGSLGYCGMVYDSTALPLTGQSLLYIAIQPQNSVGGAFSEIAVPLYGVGGTPTPPPLSRFVPRFGLGPSPGQPLAAPQTPSLTTGPAPAELAIQALPTATTFSSTTPWNQPAAGGVLLGIVPAAKAGQPVPQGPRFASKTKVHQPAQKAENAVPISLRRIVVNDAGAVRQLLGSQYGQGS
jgi:hypothetical protein